MITMHVGMDDTDSPHVGCTTYVASLIVEKLNSLGVSFIDYPSLVRLNPNVPWKTRGNGALCLRFECQEQQVDEIKEIAVDTVEKNSDLAETGTEPGIVFFFGERIPEPLSFFAKQAVQGIVHIRDAVKLVKSFKAEAVGWKSGRGIIGALAAVGETLRGDHTFELIAYRTRANRGMMRQIDLKSVFDMNEMTKPLTFNNVDIETGRVLITPHGPDPILYGIRGETATVVKRAHSMVRSFEPVERWTVFRTNQGTDAHLQSLKSIKDVHAFEPVVIKGTVSRAPWIIPRRHVLFTINDETGQVDCAAYEPTGELRRIASRLIVGDVIEAHGGVRSASSKHRLTVNLEKINPLKLATNVVFQNPLCPRCAKRLKSIGAGQGFRCDRCGFCSSSIRKVRVEKNRDLALRLYATSPRSQRHLTKPLSRYGLERQDRPRKMISGWFAVN